MDGVIESRRLLYLIQQKNDPLVKIGIATDYSRFKAIDSDYDIDWSKSVYFEGENEDIEKLEKILHRLFHRYRLDEQKGTGGTEWFATECLSSVVEAIIFNVENSKFKINLESQSIEEIKTVGWREFCQPVFDKYSNNVVEKWLKLEKSTAKNATRKMEALIPELMFVPTGIIDDFDDYYQLRGGKFLSKYIWNKETFKVKVSHGICSSKLIDI